MTSSIKDCGSSGCIFKGVGLVGTSVKVTDKKCEHLSGTQVQLRKRLVEVAEELHEIRELLAGVAVGPRDAGTVSVDAVIEAVRRMSKRPSKEGQ